MIVELRFSRFPETSQNEKLFCSMSTECVNKQMFVKFSISSKKGQYVNILFLTCFHEPLVANKSDIAGLSNTASQEISHIFEELGVNVISQIRTHNLLITVYVCIFYQVQSHCKASGHPNIKHHYQHCPAGGADLGLLSCPGNP